MRYLSKLQLGLEVARLYQKYPPFMKKWPWLADGAPGVPDFLASLKEMCWMIYQRTNTDGGAQIMGREWDTDPFAMDANIMGRVLAAAQGDSLQGSSKKGVQEFQKNWGSTGRSKSPPRPDNQ